VSATKAGLLGGLRRPRGPARAPGAITARRKGDPPPADESAEVTPIGEGTIIDESPSEDLVAFFISCGISSGTARAYATRAAARGITLHSAVERVRTKEQLTTELGMLKGHVVLVLGGLKQRRKDERDRAKAREREARRLRKGESSRRRVGLPSLRRKKSKVQRAEGGSTKSKSRRLIGRKASNLRPVVEEPPTQEKEQTPTKRGGAAASASTDSSSSDSSASDNDEVEVDPHTLVDDDYTPHVGSLYVDSSLRTALGPSPDEETALVVDDDGVTLDDPATEYRGSPPASLTPHSANAASELLASRWTSPPHPTPPPHAFIVIMSMPTSMRYHQQLSLRGATVRFVTTPDEVWGHVIVTKTVVHFVPEREGRGFMSVPLAAIAGVEEFGSRSALLRLAEPRGEIVRFSALPNEADRDDLVEVVATLLVQHRQAAELAAYKLSAIRAELECAREEAEHARQVEAERAAARAAAQATADGTRQSVEAGEGADADVDDGEQEQEQEEGAVSPALAAELARFRSTFNVPSSEQLRTVVGATVDGARGTLYASDRYVCFRGTSSKGASVTHRVLWRDVVAVRPRVVFSLAAGILESYAVDILPHFSIVKLAGNLDDTVKVLATLAEAGQGVGSFGRRLDAVPHRNAVGVPRVLIALGERVRAETGVEGVFRLSAGAAELQRVRDVLDTATTADAYESLVAEHIDDVRVAAALFKDFLRSLPEPLLTYDLYACMLAIDPFRPGDRRAGVSAPLASALSMLPRPNYLVLWYVLDVLAAVASDSAANRMPAKNLAVIFAPLLLGSRTADDDIQRTVAQLGTADEARAATAGGSAAAAAAAASPAAGGSGGSGGVVDAADSAAVLERLRQAQDASRRIMAENKKMMGLLLHLIERRAEVRDDCVEPPVVVQATPKASVTHRPSSVSQIDYGDSFVVGYAVPCARCGTDVLPRDRILAEGHLFHRACWRCAACDGPLTSGRYALRADGSEAFCASLDCCPPDLADAHGIGIGDDAIYARLPVFDTDQEEASPSSVYAHVHVAA